MSNLAAKLYSSTAEQPYSRTAVASSVGLICKWSIFRRDAYRSRWNPSTRQNPVLAVIIRTVATAARSVIRMTLHCHRNYRNRFLTLNRTTAWELWIGIFYWLTLLLSESLYWVQIPSSELNLQVVLIDIYQKKWSLYKNRSKISCPIPVKCQIGCLETVTEKKQEFQNHESRNRFLKYTNWY